MDHGNDHGHSTENKTIISFKNAFWLVIILVFLFIGAVNFISAESEGEGEHSEGAKTEMKAGEHEHGEKAAEATNAEEHKAEAPKAEETAPAADTAKAH